MSRRGCLKQGATRQQVRLTIIHMVQRECVKLDESPRMSETGWNNQPGGYLEHPIQAHFPASHGQFLSSPPQLQVVLSWPGTMLTFDLEYPEQAHFPASQGQFLSSPPHLQVVLSVVPGTISISDLEHPEQAHFPASQGQSLLIEPHLHVVFSDPGIFVTPAASCFLISASRRASL
jgi:hypothetical protein